MGIAVLALMALVAIAWMTYVVGTEMRNRAKGWRVINLKDEPGIAVFYEWKPEWKRWVTVSTVYHIRKRLSEIGPAYFTAGCFTGRYDELIERLDRKNRHPLVREWYLDQLRKASLSG